MRRANQRDGRDHHSRPAEDTWAPGHYSVLFEDPDGIRLEVNFVPGAGLLAAGAQFRPGPLRRELSEGSAFRNACMTNRRQQRTDFETDNSH